MSLRFIISGLLALLLSVSSAPAQMIHIHTADGTESFNLADVDSITFSEEEGPQAGDEREFQLTDDVTITMVWIPPGEFMMGAQEDEQGALEREYPRHRVIFENGFWMGKYEVTQPQWEAVMGNNPAHEYGVGDDYPVYYVNWDDIQDFESELDNVYRLPSESEWEYACRAGTESSYYWGDENIDDYAWYSGNSNSSTNSVGQKLPNAWNLYDILGNVFEWCEDRWHDNYEDAPDDGSPWLENQDDPIRIYHGGCWYDHSGHCRSAFRGRYDQSISLNYLGFRLVRDAD